MKFGYQYEYGETWECNECGARTMFQCGHEINFRFCVHCGECLDNETEET